jgi:hypothetical protein
MDGWHMLWRYNSAIVRFVVCKTIIIISNEEIFWFFFWSCLIDWMQVFAVYTPVVYCLNPLWFSIWILDSTFQSSFHPFFSFDIICGFGQTNGFYVFCFVFKYLTVSLRLLFFGKRTCKWEMWNADYRIDHEPWSKRGKVSFISYLMYIVIFPCVICMYLFLLW